MADTELHADHPDANAKAGDTREANGTTYIFGINQFMRYWRAGPKDGTVVCSRDYPGFGGPYRADGMSITSDHQLRARRRGCPQGRQAGV